MVHARKLSPEDFTRGEAERRRPPLCVAVVGDPARATRPSGAPDEADDPLPRPARPDVHTVANQNGRSRIKLAFGGLVPGRWCELSFTLALHPGEDAPVAQGFASVGFSFFAADGSEIDFPFVPGLAQSGIEPHSTVVRRLCSQDPRYGFSDRSRFTCTFLLPDPASQVQVTIRSLRNTHPFEVMQVTLCQFDAHEGPACSPTVGTPCSEESQRRGLGALHRARRPLGTAPRWLRFGIVPGNNLVVRGQIVAARPDPDGALARVIFRDRNGEPLPPPYPNLLATPAVGAFAPITIHAQVRRFTVELTPPPGAVSVELGLQAWREDAGLELLGPLDVSLGDSLRLETVLGDEPLRAEDSLLALARRLDTSLPAAPDCALAAFFGSVVQRDAIVSAHSVETLLARIGARTRSGGLDGTLSLGSWPAWRLPGTLTWREDPFGSPAWRREYQSLTWLLDFARLPHPSSVARACLLALQWSRANSWAAPVDPVSFHPLSVAVRADVLLFLLSASLRIGKDAVPLWAPWLLAEIVQHGFVLAETIGQNALAGCHDSMRAAASLFGLARALPDLPFSRHWLSLALLRLTDALEAELSSDEIFASAAPQERLNALSLSLVLCGLLAAEPSSRDLSARLASRIRTAVQDLQGIVDPTGSLPPFGDAPRSSLQGARIEALCQAALGGARMMEARDPKRPETIQAAGLLAARHEQSYFCTSLASQLGPAVHLDCTSFVYSAAGVPWIADPGHSLTCRTPSIRQHLNSAFAHNVALPNGRPQTAGEAWLVSTTAIGSTRIVEVGTNVHGPTYCHRRLFVYLENLLAVAVIDRFSKSSGAIAFEGTLTLDPRAVATIVDPNHVLVTQGGQRLSVVPHAFQGAFAGLQLVGGGPGSLGSPPALAAGETGEPKPATVLRYTFTGETTVCGGAVLAVNEASYRSVLAAMHAPAFSELLGRALLQPS